MIPHDFFWIFLCALGFGVNMEHKSHNACPYLSIAPHLGQLPETIDFIIHTAIWTSDGERRLDDPPTARPVGCRRKQVTDDAHALQPTVVAVVTGGEL
jgi:hypothetical protein